MVARIWPEVIQHRFGASFFVGVAVPRNIRLVALATENVGDGKPYSNLGGWSMSSVRINMISQGTEFLNEFICRFGLPMLVVVVEGAEAAVPHTIDI